MQRSEWSLADYSIQLRLYKGSYSSVYQVRRWEQRADQCAAAS